MPDDELVVKVDAQTTSAESNVSNYEERLAKLEQAFIKNAAAAEAATKATEGTGAAAGGAATKHQTLAEKIAAAVARQKEHAEISQGVSKALETEQGALSRLTSAMETHGRTIAMADDALGMKFGGSVSRVTAGLGALQGAFGASLGPVALITAGVAAAGAAFMFLKNSVDKAAEWQANLQRLGQTVKDQGGNWASLRGEVQQWADLQEATTTFSRDEAVQAVTELTSAGMGLSDAMKTVRVAEDASAASGHSLTDVVHGLMEAEHGRTQALTALGIGTRQTMKDGMAYNAVLAAIEKQMGGSAKAATETYQGAQAQLANEWQSLEENVGTKLLPMFTSIVEALEKGVFELEHWSDGWHVEIQTIESYFSAFVYNILYGFANLDKAADDFIHGHFAASARDAKAAMVDLGAAMKQNIFAAVTAGSDASNNQLNYEWNKYRSQQNAADTNTGVTAQVGGKLGGLSAADKAAREAAKALRDEIALDIQALDHKREAAGKAAEAEIKAINSEIEALKKLEQTRGISAKQREEIHGKLIALQNKEATVREEVARKAEEAEKRKQEAETRTYEQLARHLDAQVKIAEDTYGKDSAQYLNALQVEMKALADWLAKNKDANQQLVDDAKTKYAEMFKAYNDEIAAEEKLADEHEKKLEEQYKKLQDAQQKWADKATTLIESFFAKGKHGTTSFADAWKKMLADMEQALLKSAISKLLLGMFGSGGQFAGLGALFGEPEGQTAAAGTNAAQAGIIGAILGPSGASSVASSLPTSGGLMSMLFGSSAPAPTGAAMGGAPTNVVTTIIASGSGASVTPGTVSSVYGSATGSQIANLGSGGIPGIPWGRDISGPGGKASLGSYGLAAAGGAEVGQLLEGGRGFSDLGGAVGAMAGLYLGGPVGAVLGAVAGSVLGGMFNHDDPNKMPDKYATGSFGQGMADFSGAGVNGVPQFNANGQGFTENSSLYNSLGKMGMGRYIGQYIAATGGTGLTTQEIDEFRGTHGNLVSLHDGYLTIDNGKTIWWETLVADAHDAVSRILQAGGAPVFDVSHSFPDFGGATVSNAGNYYPSSPGGGGPSITPSPTPPTSSGGGGITMSPGGVGGGASFGGTVVHVYVGGSIVAQSDLVQTITEAVGAAQRSGPQSRMSTFSRSF